MQAHSSPPAAAEIAICAGGGRRAALGTRRQACASLHPARWGPITPPLPCTMGPHHHPLSRSGATWCQHLPPAQARLVGPIPAEPQSVSFQPFHPQGQGHIRGNPGQGAGGALASASSQHCSSSLPSHPRTSASGHRRTRTEGASSRAGPEVSGGNVHAAGGFHTTHTTRDTSVPSWKLFTLGEHFGWWSGPSADGGSWRVRSVHTVEDPSADLEGICVVPLGSHLLGGRLGGRQCPELEGGGRRREHPVGQIRGGQMGWRRTPPSCHSQAQGGNFCCLPSLCATGQVGSATAVTTGAPASHVTLPHSVLAPPGLVLASWLLYWGRGTADDGRDDG